MKLNPIRAKWVLPLVNEAADLFMVTPEEVLGASKQRSVARARQFAVALARHRFKWSFPELGIVFGLHQQTCDYACKLVERTMADQLARSVRTAGAAE